MKFILALLALGPGVLLQIPRQAVVPAASGLRVVALEGDDRGSVDWRAVRDAGANVVAIFGPPSPRIDERAGQARLTYLAFLTTDEIQLLARDASRIFEALSERNLAGFYYWDSQVTEGFTTPEAQRQAYTTLKTLFPDKLVLYPTRLDPIVWSPDFLDRFFRPEFTDLVTPYFYPVGTTAIGEAHETDDWQERLGGLLAALRPRIPPGKGLLPILQGFEQDGYPVGSRFLLAQFGVYRSLWPALPNAGVFAWKLSPGPGPLIEIAGRPDLQEGVCNLFTSLSRASCRSRRTISWR